MHISQVLRVVAILLLVIAFFMIFPILFALYYGEEPMIRFFLIPMAGIVICSVTVLVLTRRTPRTISTRDGFLLVSLSWIFATAVGCLPFCLSGTIPRYVDAFFETMSGYTTTGASILTKIEGLPMSMLFWRSLTHWLGGMGIVVLTAAILPLLGIGAYRLMKAEAPGPTLDKITPKVAQTAKILWAIYMFLTVAQTLLLMAGGMTLFDALTHTFGTLATGGFSPRNASVGAYDSAYIDVVVTVFMVLAGLNFILYYRLITGNIRKIVSNTEAKVYLAIFAVSSLIMALVLWRNVYPTFGEGLRYAAFQSATILTTTGYVTTDYAVWPHFAQIVLFILLFVGGCSGSTGGSIKVIRIVTLFKLAVNELRYLAHPQAVFTPRVGREPVRKDIMYTIGAFFVLYIALLLLTAFVVASAGNDILTSFSAALVTLGNIGPGFGRIGPTGNYAYLPAYVKWFLSFSMMAGRLEIYTVVILFTRRFWKD